jgi:tetratricopeptide (TPR) repeat protein
MALDPLNFMHPFGLSNRAWWFEEYATAADAAQKTIALMPDAFHGYLAAANAAAGLGDAPTAMRNLEKAVAISNQQLGPGRILITAVGASIYHQLNMPEEATAMLDELETFAASGNLPPDIRLLAYIGSSDVDTIVYWLDLAIQEETCRGACLNILHLSNHESFDGVRDDPEFRAVIKGA